MEDCIFKNESQEERQDSLKQGEFRWKIRKKNFVFAVNSESRKHVYLPSTSRTCAVETMKACIDRFPVESNFQGDLSKEFLPPKCSSPNKCKKYSRG